jgi:hypothetical protein
MKHEHIVRQTLTPGRLPRDLGSGAVGEEGQSCTLRIADDMLSPEANEFAAEAAPSGCSDKVVSRVIWRLNALCKAATLNFALEVGELSNRPAVLRRSSKVALEKPTQRPFDTDTRETSRPGYEPHCPVSKHRNLRSMRAAGNPLLETCIIHSCEARLAPSRR